MRTRLFLHAKTQVSIWRGQPPLSRQKPERQLIEHLNRQHGKNHQGRQTNRYRGGGHKKLYRKIHNRTLNYLYYGKIHSFAYDPNRNVPLALVYYQNGQKRYILQTHNAKIGDQIQTYFSTPLQSGNCLPLKNIPIGSAVHNIELYPGKGGQYVRSAGTMAVVLSKENKHVSIKLPSGEIRNFLNQCWATLGQVGRIQANQLQIGKAGRKRWQNKRPHVRGIVMNPVDHPHGGGEGKAPIGKKQPTTPWGQATLGKKTRCSKKYSDSLILQKRL